MRDTVAEPFIRTAEEADVFGTDVTRRVMARAADTGGRLSFTVATYPREFRGTNLHLHRDADEIFFVLDGDFIFRAGDVERRVGAGAFVFVPAGTPHAFSCVSVEPGRQIVMYAPGGPEAWFDELARLSTAGAGRDEIAAARMRFGLAAGEVLGPPLDVQ